MCNSFSDSKPSPLPFLSLLSVPVKSFRDPSKLLSEAGYVLTQLVSAVCFLEDVDASVLTIAHGEFERGLKGFQETARVGLQAHQQKVTLVLVYGGRLGRELLGLVGGGCTQ